MHKCVSVCLYVCTSFFLPSQAVFVAICGYLISFNGNGRRGCLHNNAHAIFYANFVSFIRISADILSHTIRVNHNNVYFLLFFIVLMLTQITQDDVFCLFFFSMKCLF